MGANPYRGAVELCVNGKTLQARLSLGALATLEEELGEEGLLPLIERFENGAFSTTDLIDLLFAGLTAEGWDGTKEALKSAEIEGGILVAAKVAGEMLALAFSPPK